MKRVAMSLMVAVLTMGAESARGNLLQNGDFELPAVTADTMTFPTFWTGRDASRTIVSITGMNGQCAALPGYGPNGNTTYWIAQNTGIQMQAGVTYTFSVYTACGNQSDVGDMIITANDTPTNIGDYYVATKNFYTYGGSDWGWGSTPNTVQYTCTAAYAGKYIGAFLYTQAGSSWVGWDNAVLTPEPATLGLMTLGGLLLRKRR